MSSFSSTYPSQRPVFALDAANAGRLDPRMTFSRSDTPPTYAAPSAVHFWSNEKHVSSENLLTDSNGFPAYSAIGVATPSVSGTFLDGTDAFVVTETVTNNSHFIYSPLHQFKTGKQYTATVFVKAGTASSIQLLFNNNVFSSTVYANYDLATPTNAPVAGADATATSTGLSDGWVKITLTGTATSSGLYALLYVVFNNDDINSARAPIYTPASAKNFYIWNAQVSTTGETVLNETSGQIHREYAPTLKSVATAGQPRFEYDPSTDGQSAARGILIEGQSTNLNTYAKNGANSSGTYQYNTSYVAATPNAAVAPDGSLSATLLTSTDAGSATVHSSYSNLTGITGNTAHTMSVYAKAAGHDTLVIHAGATYGAFGANIYGTFTLTGNGTAAASGGTATAQIESCGNGWFRCSLTETTASSPTGMRLYYYVDASSTYQGDDFSGLLLWGFQTEAQSFPSSWVGDDSSSQLSRAAESLSVDLTQAGFNGGPVSIVGEFAPIDASIGGSLHAFSLSDGTNDENIRVHLLNSRMRLLTRSNGSTQVDDYISGALSDGGYVQFGVAVETNSALASADGANSLTASGAIIPAANTRLGISQGYAATNILPSYWKRIAVHNEALSDTNLQALTS